MAASLARPAALVALQTALLGIPVFAADKQPEPKPAVQKDVRLDAAPLVTVPPSAPLSPALSSPNASVASPPSMQERGSAAISASVPTAAQLAQPALAAVSQDPILAESVGGLGLALLRERRVTMGENQKNTVVSPVSLASALGLVHAGVTAEVADEIGRLLVPASDLPTIYARDYPALLRQLSTNAPELTMVNRVWIGRSVASAVPSRYQKLVRERFAADGALIDFSVPEQARKAINQWAANQTAKRILELLPSGSVSPNTRVIATNAVHFKDTWAQQFDPSATIDKPFFDETEKQHSVATMTRAIPVRATTVNQTQVLEIPFLSQRFAFTIAMLPAGQTLRQFSSAVSGKDWRAWQTGLESIVCKVELPRFKIAATSVSLKSALQSLGMRVAFTSEANLTPMLGSKANGVRVDDVFQAAGIALDESGVEAVASTAAVMGSKSMIRVLEHPACKINRPFLFSITDRTTGAPVFLGQVALPTP